MFCNRCGTPLEGTENFCKKCGAPVGEYLKAARKAEPTPPPEPPKAQEPERPVEPPKAQEPERPVEPPKVQEPERPVEPPKVQEPERPVEPPKAQEPERPVEPPKAPGFDQTWPEDPSSGPSQPPKKKGKKWVIPLVAVLVVAIGVGGFLFWRNMAANQAYQEAVASGSETLAKGDYAGAAALFEQAGEARELESADRLALAQAYLGMGDREKAAQLLREMTLAQEDEQYDLYQRLYALAELSTQVEQVNADNFPVITLTLTCDQPFPLGVDDLTVREGEMDCQVQSVTSEGNQVSITYLTYDAEASEELRQPVLTLSVEGITQQRQADYYTPYFAPAQLRLVSTDVSQYPVVRAYFKVVDQDTGSTVEGLGNNSFRITECVEGGEYLAREVKAVMPLEGNGGLNIDLVADKSDSISPVDMGKIQTVMTQFVQELDFALGDRAEVLAFDSIVQQMCYYTDDVALLVNGINNMSTDGLTAFYDAVYDGVTNATLQGGARCVIAFTDGMDNRSRHTPEELILYANEQQTPVYIVGVGGSVEESTLRRIADSTGGRYWFIDDLYDLEEIFRQIYEEQMDYYIVEYVSDESVDSYATRDLMVNVSGQGYRGDAVMTVTPTRSIRDDGGVEGGHRYELFKESLTWEEASRKCQQMGGHLATITSQAEMDEIIAMAEAQDVKYIWLGGYTSYDDQGNVFGHWVTGEEFTFQAWSENEPSRQDQDGTEEWYIMLWNIQALNGWYWNDQRNDPVSVVPIMADGMGYVCEFE